uniref:Retrovirus-related Pol polyprotein from transposon TNT 1-94 n=1 Tax=Cajanus cajan TaxID=3821 RepID=A0A151TC44_CAJCA|nr:hypothetical protein KK1_019185 [Cajanus cajan]
MQSPKEIYWNVVIRVLHYLKDNPEQGLLLSKNTALFLTAYCDSDWTTCL